MKNRFQRAEFVKNKRFADEIRHRQGFVFFIFDKISEIEEIIFMNDSHRRKLDKFDREDVMVADNAADFPEGSKVFELTASIAEEKVRFLDFDAQQMSGFAGKRGAQDIYDDQRDDLIDLLEEYALAAAAIDDEIPGTAERLKMPRLRNDGNLIAAATSFFNDSADIKSELEEAGVRPGARAMLATFRDAFRQTAARRDSSEEKHAEATGGMNDAMQKMMNYSRSRDKFIRLKYRNNPAKLAAWTVASHLDRTPKSSSKETTPTA